MHHLLPMKIQEIVTTDKNNMNLTEVHSNALLKSANNNSLVNEASLLVATIALKKGKYLKVSQSRSH